MAEKFNKQFTCLGESTEKDWTFTVPTEKKGTRIDKNAEDITKQVYLTYYNLLIAQDFCQGHYQIWSKMFLNEFIKINANRTEWQRM